MKCKEWFIDADTHITEPGDVWTSRLPRKFRDAAPRIRAQFHGDRLEPRLAEFAERDQLVVDRQFHDASPKSTIGRSSPFSRAQSMAMS